jgi:hypothetical protein
MRFLSLAIIFLDSPKSLQVADILRQFLGTAIRDGTLSCLIGPTAGLGY